MSDYAASWPQLLQPPPPSADSLPTDDALWCSLNQLPKLDPELFSSWLNALGRAAGMGGGGTSGGGGGAAARLWLLRSPPPPRDTSGGRLRRTRARRRAAGCCY